VENCFEIDFQNQKLIITPNGPIKIFRLTHPASLMDYKKINIKTY
jgi:hypothetical protein